MLRLARRATTLLRLLLLLQLATAGCHAIAVTPDALATPGGRSADRAASLARWEEAVTLANEFLASPWRRTLPAGRFELADGGMTYRMDDGRMLRVAVASTTWGDLVVATGFRAQEGERGFCVGAIDTPEERAAGAEPVDVLVDNTFFRARDGEWQDAASLAEVTLHETTHQLYRTGTVGFWNTISYYVVAVVTLSASTHVAEDRPRATSEEFAWFRVARDSAPEYVRFVEAVRDTHLATEQPHCEHGPFGAEP